MEKKLSLLPDLPGVYLFFDASKTVIYVGKSKSLRKRVTSYFSKKLDRARTRILVSKIVDLDFIVVDSEEEALLLENSLIKEYQPRYNVLLKDDKSYPWIVVKNERFPRVFMTRRYEEDGSRYFGPYTSVRLVRTLLSLIKKLYPLRTCRYDLSEKNIESGKFKECLEFHIGNCKAPCVGKETVSDYSEYISHVKTILKGKLSSVIELLFANMQAYAEDLKFEEAQEVKEKIALLRSYQNKSTVVSQSITNVDVFTAFEETGFVYVNFMHIVQGAIVQVSNLEVKLKLDETLSDVLELAILHKREQFRSVSKEIIIPFKPEFSLKGCFYTVPKIGDKLKLLKLSEKNLRFFMIEKKKRKENLNPKKNSDRILLTLQNDLQLKQKPEHIECFDNSNIQGNYPVAACVVFIDAKPRKSEYRHFNIKTVVGANDFASMYEVVKRRYLRLKNENKSMPQLIVIDGGKGQLSFAYNALKDLGLEKKIAIVGIAKRLEELFFPFDEVPLYLDKNSESLKLLQKLRNEAHRFGITFHRNKRSSNFLDSELNSIKGIGEKSVSKLMESFKSKSKIKTAGLEELSEIIGKKQASLIYEYYRQNSKK